MHLNTIAWTVMLLSAALTLGCMAFVFLFETSVPVPVLVLGHAVAMVSAVGVKLGYILRLEAQAQTR